MKILIIIAAALLSGCGPVSEPTAQTINNQNKKDSQDCAYFQPVYDAFWAAYLAESTQRYGEIAGGFAAIEAAEANVSMVEDRTLRDAMNEIAMPFNEREAVIKNLIAAMDYCNLPNPPQN